MNDLLRKRLKKKRQEAGLTQEEVAKRLNIQRTTYGEYERGKISPPSETVEKIAKILHTTPQYLYGWDENEINAVSEMQRDVATYEENLENEIKKLNDLTPAEQAKIRTYASDIRNDGVDFGSVIKKAREAHGMSEAELSTALGTSINNVRAYEKSELFPLDKLHQLYDTLSVTYHQLVSLALTYNPIYEDIYNLELTGDELKELYKYAKYLKYRRREK